MASDGFYQKRRNELAEVTAVAPSANHRNQKEKKGENDQQGEESFEGGRHGWVNCLKVGNFWTVSKPQKGNRPASDDGYSIFDLIRS